MRTYSDSDLTEAVRKSRSWRGVLRALGLAGTSSGAIRSVRDHADRLGLDHAHFRGHRRWTEDDLVAAVAAATSWQDVGDRLGLGGGSRTSLLRGHAARLGLRTEHLGRPSPPRSRSLEDLTGPSLAHLSRSGPLLAAAWFQLSGFHVSWPLEPARYDLLAWLGDRAERIQVKTTTYRVGSTWRVQLATSRKGVHTYDPAEIERFFVIDGRGTSYLIPVAAVGGLFAIHLSAYSEFQLAPLFPLTGSAGACPPR